MASLETSGSLAVKGLVSTLGAAALGAGIMALFRLPKTRKELFFQGLSAIAGSLLFGSTVMAAATHYFPFTVSSEAVHGVVGAMSWGVFAALANLRDKVGDKDIIELFKRK